MNARTSTEQPQAPQDPATRSTTSYSVVERATVTLGSVFYIGAEAEIGLGIEPNPAGNTLAAGGLVLAGLHVGNRGFTLGVELGGGGRVFDRSSSDASGEVDSEAVLEARIRTDVWLSPWVTLGAVVGTSVLHEGEVVAGLCFGFHSWAFGGRH